MFGSVWSIPPSLTVPENATSAFTSPIPCSRAYASIACRNRTADRRDPQTTIAFAFPPIRSRVERRKCSTTIVAF